MSDFSLVMRLFASYWQVRAGRGAELCDVAVQRAEERTVAFVTKVCLRSSVTVGDAVVVANVFDLRLGRFVWARRYLM